MGAEQRTRSLVALVVAFYPELGFGYLSAHGERIGFKSVALRGFHRDPCAGDRVEADVNDDSVAFRVTLLREDSGTEL
jgi:hypothetical protein